MSQYHLMTPGPVPVPLEVRQVLAEPMLHHRTPEFVKILGDVLLQLREVFATREPVYLFSSTGSGAMEAAVVNLISPGDRVLCIVAGKFGERWAEMCEVYGAKVEKISVPWGEAVQRAEVESKLKAHPDIKVVYCQAVETSTATEQPIQEIARVVRQHSQALFAVDAITAIAAMPLKTDEWGLDVVVAGSQKAFMLPTGLSFMTVSARAWTQIEAARCPRYYFDLRKEAAANKKGETYYSSNVILVKALAQVLSIWQKRGLQNQIRRCQQLARGTRDMCAALGLQVYSKAPASSVTAIMVPAGLDGEKLRLNLEQKYKVVMMGGQDQLRGKILRLGHLGAIEDQDMFATLEALVACLHDFGFSISHDQHHRAREVLTAALKG